MHGRLGEMTRNALNVLHVHGLYFNAPKFYEHDFLYSEVEWKEGYKKFPNSCDITTYVHAQCQSGFGFGRT